MGIHFFPQISRIKPLSKTKIHDIEMKLTIIYMITSLRCVDTVREIIFHISFILIYCTSLKYYYYYLFAAALYHQLQLLKETDGEAKTDAYVSSDDDGLFLDYWPMLFWPTFWLLF